MKTPNEYKKALKEGMITPEIFGQVIYSYNKRAKNMRDQERKCRQNYSRYSKYDNTESYEDKKKFYYERKEKCLKFLTPICIHMIRQHGFERQDVKDFYCEKVECEWMDYFLLYEVGGYSFHHPINEQKLANYSNLEIIELTDLKTEGREITELLSTQFCDQVLQKLESKDLTISGNNNSL